MPAPSASLRTDHRLGSPLPRRVLVFRALRLGDMLCSVPAFRALRQALPQARITLVGMPWARAFAERFASLVDEFVAFPGHPDLPEQPPRPDRYEAFLAQVQGGDFDLAIQMHGSGAVTNAIVEGFGARLRAGFHPTDGMRPDAARFLPYLDDYHEILQLLRLMEFLGVRPRGSQLEFPMSHADVEALRALPEMRALEDTPYACIHAGASTVTKCWPAASFAQVGDFLARRGLRVVLTGVASELPITRAVARAMRSSCLDVAGHSLPLGMLAALLANARLLVSNDTGVSHLAVALGVPSVVVFSQASLARWGPLDRARHRVLTGGAAVVPAAVVEQARALMGVGAPQGGLRTA